MLIDTHLHIFTAATPLGDDRWDHRARPAPAKDALAEFQVHGVSKGILATAGTYRFHREDFTQTLAAHPNLGATTNLPWDVPEAELRRLGALGFLGIRLHWRPLDMTPDPDDAEQQRLFRLCAKLGWHVHVIDRPARLGRTIRAIERAGACVVVDHMGFIDTPDGTAHPCFQALLRAVDRGRCWVTLSGWFRFNACDPDAQARALVDAGGWDRVMWASDWPFVGHRGRVSYGDAVAALHRQVPEPDLRARIGGETAERFYFSR